MFHAFIFTYAGTNSDGSGESKPRRLKPDPKCGGAPEPGKTLPPPKRNVIDCKPYCDSLIFSLLQASEY